MINRFKKNNLILLGSVMLVIAAGLSGCGSGELSGQAAATNEATAVKDANSGGAQDAGKTAEETSPAAPGSTLQSVPEGTNEGSGEPETGSEADDSSLTGYISLMGLNRDELAGSFDEKPGSVDEGGLEFKKAGIRVWFDTETGTANQIFTVRKDIDLNGAKIGDKTDKFKEAFGEPVSDKNGDMHFKYKDVFLSVIYDTSTGETFALYILEKDF